MIEFSNVSKVYPNGTVGLDDVNLTIRDGEFVAIIGRSGAGKSTLLRAVNRMHRITSGTLTVNGTDVSTLSGKALRQFRRGIGMVFQSFAVWPHMNIFENVAFGLRISKVPEAELRERVEEALALVNLAGYGKRSVNSLSGGQQQRVAIARALVNNPQMIIADEPTGNLDPMRSLEIMMLLERINELGTTVLVVTHAKELVNRFSKRVVAIENGRIISDETGGYYNNETTI